ncbi:MAG: hypothetical protein JWN44_1331 [Myxococcales bacterium]|nr:hypothetical protein [Myxococcales bacterium]
MRDVRVGLCGFTVAIGDYARLFDVVEVQQTFYDPPREATLERWRLTMPRLEFTLKAWQLITHLSSSSTYRRLRRPLDDRARAEAGGFRWNPTVEGAWRTTLRCAKILGATAILFQCPASFRAIDENVANLRRFFGAIGPTPGVRYLWEPRGPWPDALVAELCEELGLTHVVDPLARPTVTRGLTYYRLHGTTGARHVYTDAELDALWRVVPAEGTTYVMFNNMPRVGDSERFVAMGGITRRASRPG